MGLDVYFRRDIANILRAVACAGEGATGLALELMSDAELCAKLDSVGIPQEKMLQVYRQGMRHALVSVGLAFGLEPVGVSTPPRPGASPALAGLLWAEVPRES